MFYAEASFRNQVKKLLSGIDPSRFILAYDTAADYQNLTNLSAVFNIELFVESLIPELQGKDGFIQYVIPSFSKEVYENVKGLNCTTVNQTLVDLLRKDGDDQVIQESLANYYFAHNESYDDLDIPADVQKNFEKYGEWAKEYYSS